MQCGSLKSSVDFPFQFLFYMDLLRKFHRDFRETFRFDLTPLVAELYCFEADRSSVRFISLKASWANYYIALRFLIRDFLTTRAASSNRHWRKYSINVIRNGGGVYFEQMMNVNCYYGNRHDISWEFSRAEIWYRKSIDYAVTLSNLNVVTLTVSENFHPQCQWSVVKCKVIKMPPKQFV